MSIEILDCLKRKRDICVKAIITSQNTAFRLTPALSSQLPLDLLYISFTDFTAHRVPRTAFNLQQLTAYRVATHFIDTTQCGRVSCSFRLIIF